MTLDPSRFSDEEDPHDPVIEDPMPDESDVMPEQNDLDDVDDDAGDDDDMEDFPE